MTKFTVAQTRNAFAKAWEIAREGAAKFGGSVRAYFRFAIYEAYGALQARPTRKEIVGTLDLAARKADLASFGRGATSKQTWFLAGLLEQAGFTFSALSGLCSRDMLTKAEASSLIDTCLADAKRAA